MIDSEDIRDPGQDRHDEECCSLHVRDHIREDRDAAQDLDAFRKDGGRMMIATTETKTFAMPLKISAISDGIRLLSFRTMNSQTKVTAKR